MTLLTTISRNNYPGAGSVGPFAYSFKIQTATDLELIRRTAAGAETVLAYPADYAVTGVGEIAGGTVTLATALAVGETLAIRRVLPVTQPSSFRNLGTFLPAVHEDAYDRLAMIAQQQQDELERSVRLPRSVDPATVDTELPAPVPNRVIAWDATGVALENRIVDGAVVTLPGNGRTTATLTDYLAKNAYFNVKDFGAVGNGVTDDYAAFAAAITAARAAGTGIYVPATTTSYKISATLVLGSSALAFVPMIGDASRPGLSYTGAGGFLIDCSGTSVPTLVLCGPIENITLYNPVAALTAGGIKAHYTALLACRNVKIYADGVGIDCNETISSLWVDCYLTPAAASMGLVGKRGFARNFVYEGGRIYGFDVGIELSGESHLFHGTNIEFCTVVTQVLTVSAALFDVVHIESCVQILTNAVTIPLVRAGGANWVDNGSAGSTQLGGIRFHNCHCACAAYSAQTNAFVIKTTGGFVFELTIDGGFWSHDHLAIVSSFTPGSAAAVPSGSLIKLLGRMPGNIAISVPVDASSLLVREDDNQLYMQQLSAEVIAIASALVSGNVPATAGAVRMTNGTGINYRNQANNADVAVLYQTAQKTHVGSEIAVDLEVSGGTVVLEVDASAVAGNTRLLLWDVTAGALVRVSRGAVDSGGAGFRLLRIPN